VASRVPGLPEIVDQIVQRCLAKSAIDRFQSMRELVEALGYAEQVLQRSSVPHMAGDVPPYMPTRPTPHMRMPTPLLDPSAGSRTPTPAACAAGAGP
jgi:hypothetical protein